MNVVSCGIPLHPLLPRKFVNNSQISSPLNPSSRTRTRFTVKCCQREYAKPHQPTFNTRPSPPQDSFSQQQQSFGLGASPSRVFVGYSVYKGKSALTITPKAPDFTSLDSGAYKVFREGVVLLQFAPASGTRQYDWSRKQVFSLSVTEIGTLMGLGARDSCEFFHDPNKGKSEEGKVRKILKVEPLPDGSGHFFNLSVQNKLLNVDESIYIPISKAEFTVIVSSFSFILPFLLGWHAFADSIKPEESVRFNNVNSQVGTDLEWNG